MSIYTATICKDGDGSQIVVHWDDNDPNRFITAPIMVDRAVTDETELSELLGLQGWRIVSTGSDNIGRGWAMVSRIRSDWPFYNPLTGNFQAFLHDGEKREILGRWPDADVPMGAKPF